MNLLLLYIYAREMNSIQWMFTLSISLLSIFTKMSYIYSVCYLTLWFPVKNIPSNQFNNSIWDKNKKADKHIQVKQRRGGKITKWLFDFKVIFDQTLNSLNFLIIIRVSRRSNILHSSNVTSAFIVFFIWDLN